ncbi:MAG TPA: PIN domain-containing protein [Thermomicrobiales bacterium]|nr:PIN domain-containing protein [Thermomicrobiales bacterium]
MSQPVAAPIVVLDSSVLVPYWSRISLQRAAQSGHIQFTPIWSEWIIAESWRVLTWRWAAQHGRIDASEWRTLSVNANDMLRRLISVMTLVSIRDYQGAPPWTGIRDPDDVPIWETAIVAGAQYVISHNVSDFPPLVSGRHVHTGIEYLTATEFIEDILHTNVEALYGASLPSGSTISSRRSR